MIGGLKASERLHARSALNTTQASRRNVVMLANYTSYGHIGDMRHAYNMLCKLISRFTLGVTRTSNSYVTLT